MLNTAANWATIVSAVPVAIAASVFLFRTVPTAIRQPKGLRLGLEPAIGDPGCCVHITNYGPVEHYLSRVGAMPAHLRPRWSVCTKRINRQGRSPKFACRLHRVGDNRPNYRAGPSPITACTAATSSGKEVA